MSVATWKTVRVALLAGISKPIYPPIAAHSLEIGNAGADDIKVYSTDADESTYFVITAGYARVLDLKQFRFAPDTVACYLKCAVDATAVLVWK